MSWQLAPGLLIICGCFTATGVLLHQFDKLLYGRHRRIYITEFERALGYRDLRIKTAGDRAVAAAAASAGGKH